MLASDSASATGCRVAALGSGGRSAVGILGSRSVSGSKRGCRGAPVRSGPIEVLSDAAGRGSVTVSGCSIEAEVSGRSVRGELAGAGSDEGAPVRSGPIEVLGDAAGGGSVTVSGCSIEAEVSGRSVRGELAGAGSGDEAPLFSAPTAPTLLITVWNNRTITSLSAGRQKVPTTILWSETAYPAKTTRSASSLAPIFPVTLTPGKPKVLVNGSLFSRW